MFKINKKTAFSIKGALCKLLFCFYVFTIDKTFSESGFIIFDEGGFAVKIRIGEIAQRKL